MRNDVQLKDVCEITSGQAAPQGDAKFSNNGTPFIRAGSLEALLSGTPETSLKLINFEVAKAHRLKLFPKDTILFAKSGMSAKIGRVYRLKKPSYVVSHLAAVIPGNKIDPSYLQRWFEYNPPSRLIPNDAYPSIRTSEIEKLKISLPPLPKQRRIAVILDKADSLRRKRQQSLTLLNQFLRSVFLNMFDDLRKNSKQYMLSSLGSICDVRDGTHDSPKYVEAGYPLVTSKNVVKGFIDLSEVNYIAEKDYENINRRSKVDKGDILMPMIGTIGNPVLVEEEPAFAIKNVALIKFKKGSPSRHFIHYLLGSYYFDFAIKTINRGGTQKFIALGDIRKLPIPLPEKDEIENFDKILFKISEIKRTLQRNAGESNSLFHSLTQRAFRGEL